MSDIIRIDQITIPIDFRSPVVRIGGIVGVMSNRRVRINRILFDLKKGLPAQLTVANAILENEVGDDLPLTLESRAVVGDKVRYTVNNPVLVGQTMLEVGSSFPDKSNTSIRLKQATISYKGEQKTVSAFNIKIEQ